METEISKCIEVLKQGGVILYPTDTIWGLGCDATRADAVEKIINIKKRDHTKSFIVLLDDAGKLFRYVQHVPDVAYDIIECADRPTTIIFDKGTNMAPNVMHHDGSVAIRIVKDEFCAKLIRKLGRPIVSTSANFSGDPAAANFSLIHSEIKKSADYIVNLRQNEHKKSAPSLIIKIRNNGEFVIIRK